jgi:hypothetical protein
MARSCGQDADPSIKKLRPFSSRPLPRAASAVASRVGDLHFLPIGVDRFANLCHNHHSIHSSDEHWPIVHPGVRFFGFRTPFPFAAGHTVNNSLVCLVLALSSFSTPPAAPELDPSAIFRRAEPVSLMEQLTSVVWAIPSGDSASRVFDRPVVVRGQSPVPQIADGERRPTPTYRTQAGSMNIETYPQPSTNSAPTSKQTPYEETQPHQPDPQPLLTQPAPSTTPFMTAPPPAASMWGANGPQPYRLGYSLWADVGWLAGEKTDLALDDSRFEVFETNIGLIHTIPTWWSPWLFGLEHQFNYRGWEGPVTLDLPGSVYRFGWDLRLETPLNSPYAPFSISLAFNPSINTDFNQGLSREALNFDGRGILFWQADPQLLIGVGAAFWDRVNDRVIPYAGFVWTPDPRWEFRIMWPQSRIQYYLGNHMGEDVWIYANGEYHIESYQIGTTSVPAGEDQIELEDYRVLIGLRKSNPIASGFLEAGWVFGRKVDLRAGGDFDISSGFIARVGLRF